MCGCLVQDGHLGNSAGDELVVRHGGGSSQERGDIGGCCHDDTSDSACCGLVGMVGLYDARFLGSDATLSLASDSSVVTVGTPALWLLHAKKKWKNLTIKLNESFWESAVDHPDIFVDNITHWSSQHDPAESVRAKR
jgi:hypothetical protein